MPPSRSAPTGLGTTPSEGDLNAASPPLLSFVPRTFSSVASLMVWSFSNCWPEISSWRVEYGEVSWVADTPWSCLALAAEDCSVLCSEPWLFCSAFLFFLASFSLSQYSLFFCFFLASVSPPGVWSVSMIYWKLCPLPLEWSGDIVSTCLISFYWLPSCASFSASLPSSG